MRYISIPSVVVIILAATSQVVADPMGLLKDAQSILPHGGGRSVISLPSLTEPEDQGNRAHTHMRVFAPARTSLDAAATSGPPYAGYNFETPASLACIYGLAPQTSGCNPNTVTAVAQGGSRAIAIVDAYHHPNAMADLKYFSAQFGLPAPTRSSFQVVFASGYQPAIDRGWELEEALDVQLAHAMAPNTKLYLVEAASNLVSALLAAVDKAAQLVASAGGGEVSMSWGRSQFPGEAEYDPHFQRNGEVFFAPTGDSPSVEWPSASANVVSVGGTSLSRQLGTLTFLHHASWSDGGGTSGSVVRPSNQLANAELAGTTRGVPEIAAVADPTTGVGVYDSGNGGWFVVGGKSVSAPLLAGIVNSAGHFNASSAAELTQIYHTSASNPAAYAAATIGNGGSQAASAVAKGPSPNHSTFSASSSSLTDTQLDTLTGLTGGTIPQFIYRSATGQYGGSFLGTSQYEYSSYAGLFEASAGTYSSPKTTAGPVIKVSRTGGPPVGSCVNNVDSECDASLAVYSLGLPADTVQTSALYAGAVGSSTISGSDVVGALLSGRVTGSGVGVGTGAYLEGRRDTTTGLALGAEVRSMNITSSNCYYNTGGIGTCDGLWVTSNGNGTNTTKLSSAVHVGNADPLGKWTAGLTINTNAVTTYGIDEESTATNGIYENGTHTYGLLVGPNAGKAGIGTLTPTYPLDVTGSIRTSQALLNSSSAPTISSCGATPPAAAKGSNNTSGQFTLGTKLPTACTVTFANAYPTAAFCTVTPASSYAGPYYISAQSAWAFTVTLGTGTSNVKFNYTCMGN